MKKLFLLWLLAVGLAQTLFAQTFVHPGGLHTLADLNRMKTNVLAGNHPWIDDWNVLITDPEAQSNYTDHATGDMGANRQNADADAHAAYLNTIRWYISGDANFANEAVKICNDWSADVNQVPSNTGLVGLPIMDFALEGELLRAYTNWSSSAGFTAFTNMMVTYLYPSCNGWVTNQSQTTPFAHWTSWDSPNNAAIIAMGVLCDNTNFYNQAVNFFESGNGAGAISNAVPFLHGSIGQCDESGRDQEHCTLGIADLGMLCQVAWNQGLDLYGYGNNRLLAGIEYVAQYNLSHNVPYTSFNEYADNSAGDYLFFISNNGRGRIDDRPVYEMFYNHYVVLQGLSAPNTTAMAQLYRPDHGSADHFGYQTLTFTLNAAASPYPTAPLPAAPCGLMAQSGISQATLNWATAQGDLAQGYNVLRSTISGGPYASVAMWNGNTSPTYTDTSVTNGITYYYVVAAINQNGATANSAETSVTPGVGSLPAAWISQDIGTLNSPGITTYTGAGDNTFAVTANGGVIAGTYDGGFHYTYVNATNNFTIIARMTGFTAVDLGLMMRASLATNAALVQLNLGGSAREIIFGVRQATGANLNHYNTGDQFTTPPTWYKLARNGSTISAYQSDDGVHWVFVQSATPTWGSTYYAGIAVVAGSATFDNVAYTNAAVTGTFAPPAAPTGLAASAVASNQVNLTWSAVTNAVSYNLRRSNVSGSGYSLIASNISAAAYFDATAAASTPYYYVVSAINGGGESTNSTEASATISSASVPAAPVGLTAAPSPSSVVLNWSASIGASSYNVWRSTIAGGPYTSIATGVVATFTDTNVTTGTRYFYVVSAVNAIGEGSYSDEVSAWVGSTLQTYLKFDETGGTTAFDSTGNGWNGTLVNGPVFVAGYSNNAINLSSNSSQYVTLPTGVVSTLTNFSITAWVKQATVSTWARIFDFGTGTTVYMFLSPQSGSGYLRFAITIGSSGAEQQINTTTTLPINVWTHVAVTLNGSVGTLYMNGVAVGTTNTMTLNPSSLGSTTQNYIGKSQWNDPYFNGLVDDFRIYNGTLSAGDVATFLTPLAAPTNPSATPGDSQIALNWNSAVRATSYNVLRSITDGGPYALVASVATTNDTDTGLVNGTTYYYVITAMNAVGQSANSAQISARPVSMAPPQLNLATGGGQLQFTWPPDHTGWSLQAQTNSPGTGLGTNWVTMPGSNATNQMTLPVDAANGSVFYRLVYP